MPTLALEPHAPVADAEPLLLFYALSQAGRAIAAARLDDPWRLSGHGLKAPAPADASAGLLRRVVKPDGEQASIGRRPSFAGVAEAIGSGQLTVGLELGALWAAIPDTLLRYLDDYPAAEGAYMWHTQRMSEDFIVTQPGPEGLLPVFCWRDVPTDIRLRAQHLDAIAPHYRGRGSRLLLPRAGCRDTLSPLMLWWALLFGLSSITRYYPETWVGALAVNDSELAVPIEAALDAALEALPDLILDALTDHL